MLSEQTECVGGIELFDHLGGTIGGAVVDNDEFEPRWVEIHIVERIDEFDQLVEAVVGRHDDRIGDGFGLFLNHTRIQIDFTLFFEADTALCSTT